jgi:hypothetical protein
VEPGAQLATNAVQDCIPMPEARRIRPEELAKAVGKAVELAKTKHKLDLEPYLFEQDFARIPWWIVGRRLRESDDLKQALTISETITNAVNDKGTAFQPATLCVGKDILVGFIERFGNQVEIPTSLMGPSDLS